ASKITAKPNSAQRADENRILHPERHTAEEEGVVEIMGPRLEGREQNTGTLRYCSMHRRINSVRSLGRIPRASAIWRHLTCSTCAASALARRSSVSGLDEPISITLMG